MPRASILDRLSHRVSEKLDEAIGTYDATGAIAVPINRAGAINVSKLPEAWDLGKSDRQHLYRPELAGLINEACKRLGIGGIATGKDEADVEADVHKKVAAVAAQARNDARSAVEAKAEVRGLLDRIRGLERDKTVLQMRVASLEDQLALVHQGLLPRL